MKRAYVDILETERTTIETASAKMRLKYSELMSSPDDETSIDVWENVYDDYAGADQAFPLLIKRVDPDV